VRESMPVGSVSSGCSMPCATTATALTNLGVSYQEPGRLEEAISCYQQSLAIMRETGDQHGEGTALTSLGLAY
jgi:hypothetical protein